jgi:hypothetical protein
MNGVGTAWLADAPGDGSAAGEPEATGVAVGAGLVVGLGDWAKVLGLNSSSRRPAAAAIPTR